MSDEKTIKRQPVLIIGQDARFLEELYNLLLSVGCQQIEETDSFAAALEKLTRSSYGAIVADAGPSLTIGVQFVTDLAGLSPDAKIVLMIEPRDHPAWSAWDQIQTLPLEIHFLIKIDFARNLLYLLETDCSGN